MSDFESFRSYRVWTSLSACWTAFETSCRSTLLTMSKVFSAINLKCNKRVSVCCSQTELRGEAIPVKIGLKTGTRDSQCSDPTLHQQEVQRQQH